MSVTVRKLLVRAVAPIVLLAALGAMSAIATPVWAGQAGQPEGQAAAQAASRPEVGGEADLKLPDLSSVDFRGVNGRTLLMSGLVVAGLGLVFGLVVVTQLKNLPVHSSMREVSELIYETCKTYLTTQGKFILILWLFIGAVAASVLRPACNHGRCIRRGRAGLPRINRRDHPGLQPDRHRRQLRRRVVRHPRQHVRELAGGVRQPARQAVSDLRDSAARRHEHRHAAHQRRAVSDALHPAVRSPQLRRRLLHRLRHRRVARRGGAAHRGRHLHEDRRHRLGSDEDRLQHQRRRRAKPRRHRRLHGRQRGRLGRPERRRLRDVRRHWRRAHYVHPAGRPRRDGSGAAARVDLRHAHHDDRRERPVVLPERDGRPRRATATPTR